MTSRDELFIDPLRTRTGRLTRVIDLRRTLTFVERIDLRGNELVWKRTKVRRFKRPDGSYDLVSNAEYDRQSILTRQAAERSGRDLLQEFIGLDTAEGNQILAFAQTWGVLDLCWHNIPCSHASLTNVVLELPPHSAAEVPQHVRRQWVEFRCISVRREPLETYRFFGRQAKTILRIAAALQHERLADPADWSIVLRAGLRPRDTLEAQREVLDEVIEGCLSLGNTRIAIDNMSHRMRWAEANLFGELAVQLYLAVTGCEGLVFCTFCGKKYQP